MYDEAMYAGGEHASGIDGFIVHGEHQYRQLWMVCAHVAHELDAVALLQTDIRYHHVGTELLDRGARIPRRFRFAAHDQVVFILHDAPQSLAHDRMIVDDEYAPGGADLAAIRAGCRHCRPNPCTAGSHTCLLLKWRVHIVSEGARLATPLR